MARSASAARTRKGSLAEYQRKRDFGKTAEPKGGSVPKAKSGALQFVVQKHAASHLHYDLRLEMAGVMKSWAVPKGPSAELGVKRFAVQVEDHPVEYNTFEGTIPKGEYGGGTVMLWDRGTYEPDDVEDGEDPGQALLKGLKKGKLSVTFRGERLKGSYALVRTSRGGEDESDKPKWLLLKHEDRHADPKTDLTERYETSIETGRTMEEITDGKGGGRVWTREGEKSQVPTREPSRSRRRPRLSADAFSPMLAVSASEAPTGKDWTYEPKWDGVRVLAFVQEESWALFTRNGNDKSAQFPEVGDDLKRLAQKAGGALVLDAELVGRTPSGQVLRFESLQARMHSGDTSLIETESRERPAALVVFDALLIGDEVLASEPWADRREHLESLLDGWRGDHVMLGETTPLLDELLEQARVEGWEGIMAKKVGAPYTPGKRSKSWLKIKLEQRQEFVVGGYTRPKGSRSGFGSLLLGVHDTNGKLVYAGHVGTGFTEAEIQRLMPKLKRLSRKTSPFTTEPKANEHPSWVTPKLVVEVKFNEWTGKGKLRQASYLGMRDDKDPKDVVREKAVETSEVPAAVGGEGTRGVGAEMRPPRGHSAEVVAQLEALETEKKDGVLELPGGAELPVTNLAKVFYPKAKITKGELMRYYASVAPLVLPWMEGRPLVLRRHPNGIEGKAFYQQTPDDEVPGGVRVEVLLDEDGREQRRLVGGALATLLYTVQLGAIGYDPWHSRVGNLEYADYTILDLDPGVGTSFGTVAKVALACREEMDRYGLHGALKMSGSTGVHLYLPLPEETPLEAARLVAEILATSVARRHPKIATTQRMVKKRPKGTVYVDFLQNLLTKTVSGVWAARAKPGATVSAPLAWEELEEGARPEDFTVRNVVGEAESRHKAWEVGMREANDLSKLQKGRAA